MQVEWVAETDTYNVSCTCGQWVRDDKHAEHVMISIPAANIVRASQHTSGTYVAFGATSSAGATILGSKREDVNRNAQQHARWHIDLASGG
ncbi:hypothetical protein CBI38_36450 (plasmid) [Rhodococcus oxybenzonivorans]|uniref:Uncharacterized protein n=1 Tax=Rhodococcus oxybenzonivorans TaxID=1990687 RepID=A0A2S2C7S0_9NOCA|nr:hypothetical protein [Rhodococcus oxybenzonivorans]AWK76874.1 hypothetical protein CBI38_36450 [Rhodococcus oxybenzonivorans]